VRTYSVDGIVIGGPVRAALVQIQGQEPDLTANSILKACPRRRGFSAVLGIPRRANSAFLDRAAFRELSANFLDVL
jgi:hypothetical protein